MQKNHFCRGLLVLMWIVSVSIPVFGQGKVLTGTIVDDFGDPVVGATVVEKETPGNGTTTDLDGKFSFNLTQRGKTLVVSYVGMLTQEVSVNGKTNFNIKLEENTVAMEDVVVVGYGTMRKRDLTGAVASVSGQQLAKLPVANVATAMAGRLPGVQITTADGSPDAEILIRVRGGGSVTGDNSPLYIVDGFPVSSISDVSPADIESIDVLKDASSTAIYGSQGANGVVIITTKSAKGGKTKVNYSGFLQNKRLSKRLDVMDTYEYVMYNYELAAFGGEDGIKNFEKTFGVYEDLDLYKYIEPNDWQEDMFGANVTSKQHSLSVTGGTDKTQFALSGNYNYDGGLMENNDYTRLGLNFKMNHDISDKLKLSFNMRMADTEVNGAGTSGDTYKVRTTQALTSMATRGLTEFIIPDLSSMTEDELEEYNRSTMSLSEQAAQYWKRKNNRTFNFTSALDWNIIQGMTYRLEAGYDFGFNETKNYWGQYTNNASYVGGLPLVDWTKENTNKYRVANTLTYNFNLDVHRINAMVGQEVTSYQRQNNYVYSTGYGVELTPDKIFANLGLGATSRISSSVSPKENFSSFFGRVNYNYLDRYLVTLTAREDGTSKFRPGPNQWGFFPAASAAWRMSEEEFMSGQSLFSNLKLRLSYGEVGNVRIGNTLYKLDYSIKNSKTYSIGDQPNNYYGATNSQLPNPDLKWETTITRDLGLDFGLWDDRISGMVDVYWNTTKDLLIASSIVAPGYTTQYQNVGQTSNRGIEFSFNSYLIEKKNMTFSANFNIGFNRSNVDKLAEGVDVQEYASGWASTDMKGYYDFHVRVGKPVGMMYGFVTDGYYTTDDFEYWNSTTDYKLKAGVPDIGLLGGVIGVRPGTVKFKNLDDDATKVDENDRTYIGNANPDFVGGFGLNATYHGFDASMLFSFVYGNDVYNANKIATSQRYRTTYTNLLNSMNSANSYRYLDASGEIVTDLATLKAMNEEGANKKNMWSPHSFGNAVTALHSWAIEDGSFLRLQNVTLGYTLPRDVSMRVGCEQFRVYCTLNNVFVLTNYSGYDPEVNTALRNSSTSGITPGVDYSGYPKSLSTTIGLNLTF